MPAISKCRKCGICCYGCIFISYNPKIDLFKCLIYRNKHRDNCFQKYHFNSIEQIERDISAFIFWEKEGRHPCHDSMCYHLKQFLNGIGDEFLSRRKERIEECKEIENIRKTIPNFKGLVEILKV